MARTEDMRRDPNWNQYEDMPTPSPHDAKADICAGPYDSDQPCGDLPAHLERIAQRDYSAVNEGYWVLRDAATMIRVLLRGYPLKISTRSAKTYEDTRPIETGAPTGSEGEEQDG